MARQLILACLVRSHTRATVARVAEKVHAQVRVIQYKAGGCNVMVDTI